MILSVVTVVVIGSMVIASVAVYLLPVLIGGARRVPDIGAVAVINVLLGWTLVGWVVALAMALRSASPAGPVVQVVHNPPRPAPPPQLHDARWAGPPGPPPSRPEAAPPLALPPRSAGPAAPPDTDETSYGPAGAPAPTVRPADGGRRC